MKTRKYGRGVKAAVTVLEVAFMTLCVVCIGIVSCNAVIRISGRPYYISPFSKTEDFEDSDVFYDVVYDSMCDVVRYGVIRNQMETDGIFDEEKEIDIEQYARHLEEVPVTATSISYRLGDLLQWGQYGEGISVNEYTCEQVEQMIREEKERSAQQSSSQTGAETAGTKQEKTEEWEIGNFEKAKSADEEEALVEVTEHVYVAEGVEETILTGETVEENDLTVIEESIDWEPDGTDWEEENAAYEEEDQYALVPVERYLPADGRSMLAHVDSVEELENMIFYLRESLHMLGDNYISYKEYQQRYDNEEMNFKYYIVQERDGKTQVYTNTAIAGKEMQEVYEYFSGLGRSLYFSPADFTYESNMSIREESVRGVWNKYRYAYPDDTLIWVGIDTSFQYADLFQSAQESYQMAAPGYLYILCSVICGILALVLLGVMTYMASRKTESETISLLWFDRWYTEVAASLAAGVVLSLFVMTGIGVSELYYDEMADRMQMLTALAVGSAITGSAFLFFYLSLIRRIKAGIFWKNFLIYRIFLAIKRILMRIYDDSRNVVRIWVPYLLFVSVNLFLISLDNPFERGGTFIAIVLDLFVGIFLYYNNRIRQKILKGIEKIRGGDLDYQIDVAKMHGDNRILAEAVNSIGNGIRHAVETSMKDERMKADLITNVSHDIKTPLTSIINYVDLIKREETENEKVRDYLKILENKSQRLKQLTEDLVEASKISSGNIELQCDKLDLVELMNQTVGEFVERFEEKGLRLIVNMEERPLLIYADSRRIWRVVENLFHNVNKYALENTRVYVEVKKIPEDDSPGKVRLSIKNISDQPLNLEAEDLTERFIRGDAARTTEGSGLGLSIAKNLTELQKGKFEIFSDGDLFKVVITFSLVV